MKAQKMQANLQLTDGTVRPVPIDIAVVAVTSGGATKTVTFNNIKAIKLVKRVVIVTSAGVHRLPSGAVTSATNVVTVADGSFANGDTIIAEAIGYNS
ncbi:hypothetical protein [Rhizobium sp. Nf11,1]|uniref:hypothetical protein n=1 Tax=Rhizobium sp. Nf11,1 TaxID=3404923 RepID=UPI003D3306DA